MNYTGTVSDEGWWGKNERPQQNNKYLVLEVMAKRGWMEIYIGDAQWDGVTLSSHETQKGTMMLLSNSLVPSKNTSGVLWDQQQGVDSHRKGLLRYENTKRHLQLCKRSK